MKNNILFDLDGTLTNSYEGISNAVIFALQKMNYGQNPENLERFIGPPLQMSFMKFCGYSSEKAAICIKYFREFYNETGVLQNKLYDGMPQLLQALKQNGCTLHLATSKPIELAIKVLSRFDILKYFLHCTGTPKGQLGVEKGEIIKLALEKANINPSTAIMVGDREHDIIGAKQNNITSVGVLYGFGTFEEHKQAGATYIVKDIDELQSLLLS